MNPEHLCPIEKVMLEYYETDNPDLLEEVFRQASAIAASWCSKFTKMKRGEVFNDYVSDVALEFTARVAKKNIIENSVSVIQNLVRVGFNSNRNEILCSDPNKLTHRLQIAEIVDMVKGELRGIDEKDQYVLLYLIAFPERVAEVGRCTRNRIGFYLLVIKVFNIRKAMQAEETIDMPLPKTSTGKMLLLEKLFHSDPALLVLFLLFQDMDKFLQFCKIFGDQNISVPDFNSLKSTFKEVLSVSTNMEKGSMTSADSQIMKDIVLEGITENSQGYTLSPVLDEFCKKSISSIVENYDAAQKKAVAGMNVHSFDKTAKLIKFLNSEMDVQFKMFSEIAKVVETLNSKG